MHHEEESGSYSAVFVRLLETVRCWSEGLLSAFPLRAGYFMREPSWVSAEQLYLFRITTWVKVHYLYRLSLFVLMSLAFPLTLTSSLWLIDTKSLQFSHTFSIAYEKKVGEIKLHFEKSSVNFLPINHRRWKFFGLFLLGNTPSVLFCSHER